MTTPEPTTPTPNWWQRRSTKAKVAIIGASLVVLIGVFAPEPVEPKDKPGVKAAAKVVKPKAPLSAMQKLTKDVKKNAIQQAGKADFREASCAREDGAVLCSVSYELGSMWDADDDEVARDIGGMLHELFRDTDVQYLRVGGETTTVDKLGKETPHSEVAWVYIRRSGWDKVNWDNLQYKEPAAGLRAVSEVYADALRN